jgi:hypothetical protein
MCQGSLPASCRRQSAGRTRRKRRRRPWQHRSQHVPCPQQPAHIRQVDASAKAVERLVSLLASSVTKAAHLPGIPGGLLGICPRLQSSDGAYLSQMCWLNVASNTYRACSLPHLLSAGLACIPLGIGASQCAVPAVLRLICSPMRASSHILSSIRSHAGGSACSRSDGVSSGCSGALHVAVWSRITMRSCSEPWIG